MRTPQAALTTALLLLSLPTAAFECANSGAGNTPADDFDVGSRTACGGGAVTSGPNSTAVGSNAVAAGDRSIALGRSAAATGSSSNALGFEATADASDSNAVGTFASATGMNSTAVGSFSNAQGLQSIALGAGANSSGDTSVAVGTVSISAKAESTALGSRAVSFGNNSTALGYRALATNDNTMILGSIPGKNFGDVYVDVAIGTTAPLAPLHIFRGDTTQEMLILESSARGGPQDRAMIQLINNGGIRFQFDNPNLSTAWRFQAATGNRDSFEVTKVGTGDIEFRIDDNGNATLAGMLFENSDRNAKTNIETVDPEKVLAKLAKLPISEWEYKDTPGQRHVGPMAQDFREAFGLGANDTSLASIDTSGVALASIKALEARNRALEAEMQHLKALVAHIAATGAAAQP